MAKQIQIKKTTTKREPAPIDTRSPSGKEMKNQMNMLDYIDWCTTFRGIEPDGYVVNLARCLTRETHTDHIKNAIDHSAHMEEIHTIDDPFRLTREHMSS